MTVRPSPVSLLILGKGWTADFLIPLLDSSHITHAATTRAGRDGTIPFEFDPDASDEDDAPQYRALPDARVVLITFPLPGAKASATLVRRYEDSRHSSTSDSEKPVYILLGSTSIWTHPGLTLPSDPPAYRAPSKEPGDGGPTFPSDSPRARAEDALLEAHPDRSIVLCLCGLYGGSREPRKWAGRIAKSKEDVAGKKGVQFVHGKDVARGIRGVIEAVVDGKKERWEALVGKRWIVTDLRYYDWWDMLLTWDENRGGDEVGKGSKEETLPYGRWVRELMWEHHVPALPRSTDMLGRVMDGTEFWQLLGIWPSVGRMP